MTSKKFLTVMIGLMVWIMAGCLGFTPMSGSSTPATSGSTTSTTTPATRTAPAQTAQATSQTRAAPAQPEAPAQPVYTQLYNVGDTGPAGGIIFFDMGFAIDGWRYLEAAPKDFQVAVRWGPNGNVGANQVVLGSGKQNTELIISTHGKETVGAAQMATADAASYTGYDDWFLPSKDELDLLYKNLKVKGLGGFGSGWYWSSSEIGDSAWRQQFSDGSQDGDHLSYGTKPNAHSVRAIRRF
ncbi:hypothetical protein PilKf_02510 [Pillotina sp. SPG140]|jgi:hypothetical protein